MGYFPSTMGIVKDVPKLFHQILENKASHLNLVSMENLDLQF